MGFWNNIFGRHKLNQFESTLLKGIEQCIEPQYLELYKKQVALINLITRNDVEILFYHKNKGKIGLPKNLLFPYEKEEVLVCIITIIDKKQNEFKIKAWIVTGSIFSLDCNKRFDYLKLKDIESITYDCQGSLK